MRRRFAVLSATALGVALLSVGPLIHVPTKLVFNGSGSAPIAFYRVQSGPVSKGDLVVVRLPDWAERLVEERGYLPPGVPLIKRVVASKGDTVCRLGRKISVNFDDVAEVLDTDSEGRAMPSWFGCWRLERGQYFLLQDHPRSFDSRYLGPIDGSLIIGKAVPISAGDHAE
jgi:conjugative transfer signal peptidase TraF